MNFVQSQVEPILSALNRQFEAHPDPNYELTCYQPLRDLFTKYERVIKPEYSFIRNFGKPSYQSTVKEVKTNQVINMADAEIEKILEPYRLAVKEQGDMVRDMKAAKAPEIDVKAAVSELKKRKKALQDKENELTADDIKIDRNAFETCLKKRFIFRQAFELYGGVAGFFDYGPIGCMLKNNIIDTWRKHFVVNEDMLEIEASMMTPAKVLETSGHAERFADLMVKDLKTGECFRADHLLEGFIEKQCSDKSVSQEVKDELKKLEPLIEGMSKEELGETMKKYEVKAPVSGNDITDPMEFNLMFKSEIGPTGQIPSFLRPETAQGIFLNFKFLLEFNNGRLPFAGAQIGHSFRNEIAPRAGLIRCREFQMAEIEHFCDPEDYSHPSFPEVENVVLPFYTKNAQTSGGHITKCSLGEALKQKIICNETVAYFLGRIYLFAVKIGIHADKMRFRQHMDNEMAHYANDCWDLECKTSYGWVECVGCAHRGCYDLSVHAKATKTPLVAERKLEKPIEKNVKSILPDKKVIAKQFKKDTGAIIAALTSMEEDEIEKLEAQSANSDEIEVAGFKLKKDMIKFQSKLVKMHTVSFVPSVIEPSFGIGRLIYSLLEHNFKFRDNDVERRYFTIPAVISPYKCSILPISNKPEFNDVIGQLVGQMKKLALPHKVDKSAGSIGKRYARTDEIAIPYGITIDFHTLKISPSTVTLRDRDTTGQVRLPISEVVDVIDQMCLGAINWDHVTQKYPNQDDWVAQNPIDE